MSAYPLSSIPSLSFLWQASEWLYANLTIVPEVGETVDELAWMTPFVIWRPGLGIG